MKLNLKKLKDLRLKKKLSIAKACKNFEYTRIHTISPTLLYYYEQGERTMSEDVYNEYLAYLETL